MKQVGLVAIAQSKLRRSPGDRACSVRSPVVLVTVNGEPRT
ncbi:hypothetical protein [Microcoleus sp. herbarium14]